MEVIIAMKGLPCTRKTELAKHIADSLKYILLSLEQYLDALLPEFFQSCSCRSSPSLTPQDYAFRHLCSVAKTILRTTSVVIDSPLSSRSQLEQLIKLVYSNPRRRIGFLVVECKPELIIRWQTRFEEKLRDGTYEEKWYKPKSWEEVKKAAVVGSYDERSDRYKVSKLVVDPFSSYLTIDKPLETFLFIKAVQEFSYRATPVLITIPYDMWRSHYFNAPSEFNSRKFSCDGNHYITKLADEGIEYEANCRACDNELVKGVTAAYTCLHCSTALHKECAESCAEFEGEVDYDERQSIFWWECSRMRYHFHYRCSSCEEKGEDATPGCFYCLYALHFKRGILPTVIWHDCHQHFLSVLLPTPHKTKCNACGGGTSHNTGWYSCKICGVEYHYICLSYDKWPTRIEHEHGGHHHHMLIQYNTSEEAEDYLCDVCFERQDPEARDPSLWFYSCQDCVYFAHLQCGANGGINQEENALLKPCKAGSGHYFTRSSYYKERLKYKAECKSCDTQLPIYDDAYFCKYCSFALHKECAELVGVDYKLLQSPDLCNLDSVLRDGYQGFVDDSCRCSSRREDVHSNHGDCLFTAHLKSKILPTVIIHRCHLHFLSVTIKDLNPEADRPVCYACGYNVHDEIWYTCKMCGVHYDYDCLTKVVDYVAHQHNQQRHNLSIKYHSSYDTKDDICNVCLDNEDVATRDPNFWYYSCQDCKYEAHLQCVDYDDDDGSRQDEGTSSRCLVVPVEVKPHPPWIQWIK